MKWVYSVAGLVGLLGLCAFILLVQAYPVVGFIGLGVAVIGFAPFWVPAFMQRLFWRPGVVWSKRGPPGTHHNGRRKTRS